MVNYDIFLRNLASGQLSEIKERHPMRYLFQPDLEVRLRRQGLTIIRSCAWLDANRPLGPDAWYGCVLAQKS